MTKEEKNRKKTKYSPEYKIEMVKQTFRMPVAKVAKLNNIPISTLKNWKHLFNIYGTVAFEEKQFGRKKYNDNLRRTYHIDIRLNEQEYMTLMKKYMTNNYKNAALSRHFRNILLDKEVKFYEEINPLLLNQYIEIGRYLKKYGNNINEIMKRGYLYDSFNAHEKNVIKANIEKVQDVLKKLEALI